MERATGELACGQGDLLGHRACSVECWVSEGAKMTYSSPTIAAGSKPQYLTLDRAAGEVCCKITNASHIWLAIKLQVSLSGGAVHVHPPHFDHLFAAKLRRRHSMRKVGPLALRLSQLTTSLCLPSNFNAA